MADKNTTPCCTWTTDAAGLPAVDLAALPLTSGPGLPTDPWHILGNSGLTAFVHASGGIELFSGERAWARLNNSPAGWDWQVRLGERTLVDESGGMKPSAVRFGCGYAEHRWETDSGLSVERIVATPPSRDPADRCSGLLITVTVHNRSNAAKKVAYGESIGACYFASNWNNPPAGRIHADYRVELSSNGDTAAARFNAVERRPLTFAGPDEPAQADGFPPALHIQAPSAAVRTAENRLHASWQLDLPASETRIMRLAVGYSLPDLPWQTTAARLLGGDDPRFAAQWSACLAGPTDNEMQWHMHQLLAMATWDHRHRSTYIPQGTIYEYILGVAACARDHIQHALPLARLAPQYVRSTLTYLARRTDAYGHLRHTEEGAGLVPLGADQKSDSELYALLLVAEYIEHGGRLDWDVDGLPILTVAERWFRQLRDVVATGPHGLVRLLCSDWNDCFYGFLKDLPYHQVFNTAESHLNTAMAVVILGRVAAALPDTPLAKAATAYRADLLASLLRELTDRPFIPRARVGDKIIGAEEMFFEPQPWLLAIPEIPKQRRLAIWSEVRRRLWEGEPKGARQREKPGHGESGGIWYALNGPLVPALAELDPADARETLERMTLRRHRRDHPDAWVGAWSGPDCWDPYQARGTADGFEWDGYGGPLRPGRCRSYLDRLPVCCAHAHAWPLYGWLCLRDAGALK